MKRHYNAFISYRHHPDDIRVASEIHRSLERFKAPRSIRKKYGKIDQLFRDKEELPITSDLNDDIDEALKNSDYLIVICSVHLKESIWCQREIERFLQTHPRNRVLTVLASGEPYDVIPEILLYDDVVDPETGETKRIPIEPLSCDWRSKRRKTRQEELLRLAAPLLGCAYDELRQRQKQYKARRNAAIISSALVASFSLTAYFLYTSITIQKANVRIQAQNEEIQAQNEEIKEANIQIKANLDEALINQSRHLATAAQERLAEGDRLTAISLAKAALPSENNQRPYVPEAENVLISALGIYRTSNQPAAVGTVSPGENIGVTKFYVADEQNLLYLYDKRRNITVWDTESLQKLGEISLNGEYLDKFIPTSNGDMLIISGQGGTILSCYRPDGTLAWQWDRCIDVSYMPESNQVLLIHMISYDDYSLILVDAATGEMQGSAWDLNLPDTDMTPSAFLTDTLPTVSAVAIRYYSYQQTALCGVNLETVEKILLPAEDVYPGSALITGEGNLIYMGQAEGLGIAGAMGSDRVASAETRKIYHFDLRTGELLWENEINHSVYGSRTIQEIPGSSQILCQSGNVFQVLDQATGETLSRCEAGSGVLSATAGEQYASAVLQDGYVCYYWYGGNYCYEVKSMDNDVNMAAVGQKWYAQHTGQDYVTVYTSVMGEPEWAAAFSGSVTARNKQIYGKYLAFQDYTNLYLFDTKAQSMFWSTALGNKDLLGFSQAGDKLWYAEGRTAVTAIDLRTGMGDTFEIALDVTDSGAEVRGKLVLREDKLYYVIGGIQEPVLVCWDLKTQQKVTCPLTVENEEIAYWSWEVLAAQGSKVWIWGKETVLLEVDMTTGKIQLVAAQTEGRPSVAVRADGKQVALTNGGCIYLKTPGKEDAKEITLENAKAGSLCYREDVLFAICDNGSLYRLDEAGTCLSQTVLQVSSDFADRLFSTTTDPAGVRWQFIGEDMLVINAFGIGNVVDCQTWGLRTSIADFLMYDENNGYLVCQLGNAIGAYPLYDTPALLELAEEALGSFSLTKEQKLSYGID